MIFTRSILAPCLTNFFTHFCAQGDQAGPAAYYYKGLMPTKVTAEMGKRIVEACKGPFPKGCQPVRSSVFKCLKYDVTTLLAPLLLTNLFATILIAHFQLKCLVGVDGPDGRQVPGRRANFHSLTFQRTLLGGVPGHLDARDHWTSR